jgi:mRNA-degrading endonuclease RelE of RelBE toxin-antitoxin system
LPLTIRVRVQGIFERLTNWPNVSGARSLRGDLAGQYRVRTGDYRIQFTPRGDDVVVTKIGHRDGFYDE